MHIASSYRRLTSAKFVLFLALLFTCTTSSWGQIDPKLVEERERAFLLVEQGNYIAAHPLLEKLAQAMPDNVDVHEKLAYALVALATNEKNLDARVQLLKRARAIAMRFTEKGASSELLSRLVELIPPDGGANEKPVTRTPAQEALHEGEAAFTRGDMKGALAGYEKAEKLDPKLYEAPLFIGDVYFKQGDIEKAGQAYARAIAIDPDRETAYRYWGNVLAHAGKMQESRDKFIEAIIAEPYSRLTWNFLVGWGEKNNVRLAHPRVEVPRESVKRKDDKNIDILFSPTDKKDGSDAWFIYGITRASWMTEEKRKKEFPQEKDYRHSLREEADALRAVADLAAGNLKEGKVKENALDVSIANLLKLQQAGLLEAFILLAMPDQGIARDYIAYRQANRDKLRKYLREVVINGGQIGK